MVAILQATFWNAISEKLSYFYSNFTDSWPRWSDSQYCIIGSDNGLVLNGHQVIIWIKDGLVAWRLFASVGFNELTLHALP